VHHRAQVLGQLQQPDHHIPGLFRLSPRRQDIKLPGAPPGDGRQPRVAGGHQEERRQGLPRPQPGLVLHALHHHLLQPGCREHGGFTLLYVLLPQKGFVPKLRY
jgi:hypothetical protein